ncbi:uncharacterized protein [Dysidea avara]|uniref:uncharacterized protein isoform X1 n=2 Tax=Dysidea avara TaxID=196820 RepID=UPI0033349C8C
MSDFKMLLVLCGLISSVILSNKVVIAADEQCEEYRFSTPFYPGGSCETIYNMNPESHARPGYYWITDGPTQVYCGMNYTGSSCEDIFANNPETRDKEGYYRINGNQWTLCNITSGDIPTCAGVGGGWRRIVNINISAGDACPNGWREETNSGVSFCRLDSDTGSTCSSAYFSTNGTSYQRVCGRAKGFQKGETLAFHGDSFTGASSQTSIDGYYADGLLLTYGSPRQHIWTYAAGSFDNRTDGDFRTYNCPCAADGGTAPPSFVGTDYYCESGFIDSAVYTDYLFADPLWDGSGCFTSRCCENRVQPWFSQVLNETTTSDIEARLCSLGEAFRRFVMIVELELYVQ